MVEFIASRVGSVCVLRDSHFIFIEPPLRNYLLEPLPNSFPIETKEEGISRGVGERDLSDDKDKEEGGWGWGALGEVEAFCGEHFMELVLGGTVVPGDDSM